MAWEASDGSKNRHFDSAPAPRLIIRRIHQVHSGRNGPSRALKNDSFLRQVLGERTMSTNVASFSPARSKPALCLGLQGRCSPPQRLFQFAISLSIESINNSHARVRVAALN
jgi:hypothetical protein